MSGEIVIRETVPADLAAIVEVHKKGFGYDKEAGLTAELLSDPTAEPTVSLLALRDGEAVGHILFTRCRIAGAEVQQPLFYILAPLAVVPSCQKQGVGGLLIAEGLQLLRERGAKLVFVLGHKEYYPRHGFIPGAEKLGFPAPYPILEKHADYWMAQALTDDGFSGPKGRVVCADEPQNGGSKHTTTKNRHGKERDDIRRSDGPDREDPRPLPQRRDGRGQPRRRGQTRHGADRRLQIAAAQGRRGGFQNTGIVMSGEIVIRETVPADLAAIVEVHKKGFGYDKEAGLTAELLSDPTAEPTVSLLALRDGEAVGHILFTRCRIAGAEVQQPLFYILAPLAVVPSCQKQGVGGLLIAEGLQLLRERGAKLVFVLGHKEYYPRHGFIPGAEKLGFPAPYPILEKHADYWMAQALTDDGFSGPKGRVVCADALNRPEHWRE